MKIDKTTIPKSLRDEVVPGWVVLPLRLFLGVSFLSAGFDKLTDPSFLDPTARDYIGQQITRFAPGTPLEGFLLNFAVPNANLFGVLVMGGELCIGIGVLLGLLTRFSAVMGMLLNLTFFLSATWDVRPFYFGADLPYSVAWFTLVLTGAGPFALDVLVKRWLSPPQPAPIQPKNPRVRVPQQAPPSSTLTRRTFLGVSAAGLAGAVLAAAGLSWGVLHPGGAGARSTSTDAAQGKTATPEAPATPAAQLPPPTDTPLPAGAVATDTPPVQVDTPQPTGAPAQADSPTPAPTAAPTQAASNLQLLASPGQVPLGQAAEFTLASGEPAVLVHNDSGYSAYVAICTHDGCQVHAVSSTLLACPCHGAQFDAKSNGSVLRGPARRPLSNIPLKVGPDGTVYLAG